MYQSTYAKGGIRMKRKKVVASILAASMLAVMLGGCGSKSSEGGKSSGKEKLTLWCRLSQQVTGKLQTWISGMRRWMHSKKKTTVK